MIIIRLLTLIAGILATGQMLSAAESAENALALYNAGNYAQAYENLLAIEKKTSPLYFVLGDCAYKLNKKGYALLFWRKAEIDSGLRNFSAIQNNITHVKKDLVGDEEHVIISQLKSTKQLCISLIRAIPLIIVQMVFLALWIMMLLYIKYLYRKKHKTLIVVFFFLLAGAAMILAQKYNVFHKKYGVFIKEAPVYSGPSDNYTLLMHLPECTEALKINSANGFFKVKTPLGSGWVSAETFEEI